MSENNKSMLKDEEMAGVSGGNYNRYVVGDEYMILCPYCCSFHWSPCISSTVSYENYTFRCPVIGKRFDKKYTPDDEDEYVYLNDGMPIKEIEQKKYNPNYGDY
jgi:hypothetical protein